MTQAIILPETDGGWQVIMADPPWRFSSNSDAKPCLNARRHYPTMTVEDIAAMPVKAIAARSSILLLWVTAPLMHKALDVIPAWGFRYKSQLIWDKMQIGTGYWARNQHEILCIATRGAFPCPRPLFKSSILRAKRREHSRKPDEVRDVVDHHFAGMRRLELFARTSAPDWTAFGNETGKFP